MEEQRGNLDDVVPREPLGTRLAQGMLIEFAFWAVVALLWLAFEGGILGLIITAVIAVFVGIAWRDIARRAKNPIQQRPSPNE